MNQQPNELVYKGFTASYELDEKTGIYTGKVIGVQDELPFNGSSWEELEDIFQLLIDLYLQMLKNKNLDRSEPRGNREKIKLSILMDVPANELDTMQTISIQLPQEVVQQGQFYAEKKGESLEEFIVKGITEDIKFLVEYEKMMKDMENEKYVRIVECKPLDNFSLRIKYDDGIEGIYDMNPSIQEGGVFAPLSDLEFFKKVDIVGDGDYISWPGEIEIGADSIYEDVLGDSDWKP
jgi:hypothetical protein